MISAIYSARIELHRLVNTSACCSRHLKGHSLPLLQVPHTLGLQRHFTSTSPVQVKKRMPPKKAPEKEKRAILGRPSNNLKIGIVGLFIHPSVYPPTSSSDISALCVHLIRSPECREIVLLQRSLKNR